MLCGKSASKTQKAQLQNAQARDLFPVITKKTSLNAKAPEGDGFGNLKDTHSRWMTSFPPWLAQEEANFIARHPNLIAPILATNVASSAGSNNATSVSFSGHETWCSSLLRRRKSRLETIIRQCHTKFASTWASQGGKPLSSNWYSIPSDTGSQILKSSNPQTRNFKTCASG